MVVWQKRTYACARDYRIGKPAYADKDRPPILSVRQIILIGATLGCEAKRLICGRLPGVRESAAGDTGLPERNGRGGGALAFRYGIPVFVRERGHGCGVRWGMPYRIDRGSILVSSGMLLSRGLWRT